MALRVEKMESGKGLVVWDRWSNLLQQSLDCAWPVTFDSECRSTVEDALLWVGVLLGDGGGVGRVEDRLWRERGGGAAMPGALVVG